MARASVTTSRARRLRWQMTDAERKLWARLRGCQLGEAKFRRQHPIGPYVADFCCTERHLVVELDGGQHAERVEEDRRRTAFLDEHGYRVIRFWDNEVMTNMDGVLYRISEALKNRDPLTPPSPPEGERKKGEGRVNSP